MAAEDTTHHYVSTACMHGLCDERCRSTCKFCDAPCEHPCHSQQPRDDLPPNWVDQARDIAIELLASVDDHGRGIILSPDLEERIRTDPHLFWLRGEVQPPGEWKPNTDQTG